MKNLPGVVLKISRILLGVVFCFLVACSDVNSTVAEFEKWLPGNTGMSANFMKPHKVSYQKSGYSMRYEVAPDVYRGDEVWKVEIFFEGSGKGLPDTIYLDRQSLAFRGRLLPMPQYTIDVFFEQNTFKGALKPGEDSGYSEVIYNKPYPHAGFEPAIINYAISTLPLAVGFKASVPVFDLNNGSEMFWSNIEVLAEETLTFDGQEFVAFKVVSRGIKNKTLWISPELPFVLKMETEGSFGTWTVSGYQ